MTNKADSLNQKTLSIKDVIFMFTVVLGMFGSYYTSKLSTQKEIDGLKTELSVQKTRIKTLEEGRKESNELITKLREKNETIYQLIFTIVRDSNDNS